MYKFSTTIEDMPVIVEGTFEAEEPRTHTDPGCEAAFIIESITVEACDLDDDEIARLEAEAFVKAEEEFDPDN